MSESRRLMPGSFEQFDEPTSPRPLRRRRSGSHIPDTVPQIPPISPFGGLLQPRFNNPWISAPESEPSTQIPSATPAVPARPTNPSAQEKTHDEWFQEEVKRRSEEIPQLKSPVALRASRYDPAIPFDRPSTPRYRNRDRPYPQEPQLSLLPADPLDRKLSFRPSRPRPASLQQPDPNGATLPRTIGTPSEIKRTTFTRERKARMRDFGPVLNMTRSQRIKEERREFEAAFGLGVDKTPGQKRAEERPTLVPELVLRRGAVAERGAGGVEGLSERLQKVTVGDEVPRERIQATLPGNGTTAPPSTPHNSPSARDELMNMGFEVRADGGMGGVGEMWEDIDLGEDEWEVVDGEVMDWEEV